MSVFEITKIKPIAHTSLGLQASADLLFEPIEKLTIQRREAVSRVLVEMLKKTDNEYSKQEKKDDLLPVSLLNQHVSQLVRSLYASERKKGLSEKKFHFPNLDLNTFKQKASHLTLVEEIFLLAIRLEVAELK